MGSEDQDPFEENQTEKDAQGGVVPFDKSINGNVNITMNYTNQVSRVNQEDDFLGKRFGVSNSIGRKSEQERNQRTFSGRNSGASGKDQYDQNHSLHSKRLGGGSKTRQIFEDESWKRAVLPMETQNMTTADSKALEALKGPKAPIETRPGFKDYLEQEDLDGASVNDLISCKSRPVVQRLNPQSINVSHLVSHQITPIPSNKNLGSIDSINQNSSMLVTPIKRSIEESILRKRDSLVTVESALSMQRRTSTAGDAQTDKRPVARAEIHAGGINMASEAILNDQRIKVVTDALQNLGKDSIQSSALDHSLIERQKSEVSATGISQKQGGVPPKELEERIRIKITHVDTETSNNLTEIRDSEDNQAKRAKDLMNVIEGPEIASQDSPDRKTEWNQSMDTAGKDNLLKIRKGLQRPESPSSMGRFIHNIMDLNKDQIQISQSKQQQVPADHRPMVVRDKQVKQNVSALFRRKHQKSKNVINQNTALIKHDFDAGKSRLMKNHEMTQAAQIRMQQLIAMLKDKTQTTTEYIELEPLPDYSDFDEVENEGENDGEESADEVVISETRQGTELRAADMKSPDQMTTLQTINDENSEGSEDDMLPAKKVKKLKHGKTTEMKKKEIQIASTIGKFKTQRNIISIGSVKKESQFNKNSDFQNVNGEVIIEDPDADLQEESTVQYPNKANLNRDSAIDLESNNRISSINENDPNGSAKKEDGNHNQRFNTEDDAALLQELDGLKQIDLNDMNGDNSKVLLDTTEPSFLDRCEDDSIRIQSAAGKRALRDQMFNQSMDMTNQQRHLARLRGQSVNNADGNMLLRKRVINTDILTSVPKRGRMVDTKSYIRDNLQPYADNKYFAFSKRPKDQLQTLNLNPVHKRRNLIVGDKAALRTLDDRSFMRRNVAQSLQLPSGALKNIGGNNNVRKSVRGGIKLAQLDYEPIVKKRRVRNSTTRHKRKAFIELEEPVDLEALAAMTAARKAEEEAREREEYEQLISENDQLRVELQNMVVVFEQYLKVAALKQKAEKTQREQFKQRGEGSVGARVPGMDGDDDDDEDDSNDEEVDQVTKDEEDGKIDEIKALARTSQDFIPPDSRLEIEKDAKDGRQLSQRGKNEDHKANEESKMSSPDDKKNNNSQLSQTMRTSRMSQLNKSPLKTLDKETIMQKAALSQRDHSFFMNHHMPFIRENHDIQLDRVQIVTPLKSMRSVSIQLNNSSPKLKRDSSFTRRNRNNRSIVLYNLPLIRQSLRQKNQVSILALSEHKIHNQWLKEIQALSDQIESHHKYEDVLRTEEDIKRNKKLIKQMTAENMRDNARIIALEVNFIKKASKTSKKLPIMAKAERRLEKVQKRVKEQLEINAEYNMWGLGSYIIQHTIQVRLLEDLIECAQKCQIRPDGQVEMELALMKRLCAQTWEDIQTFLEERDKDRWRTWDNPRNIVYTKPNLSNDKGGGPSEAELVKMQTKENKEIRQWIEVLYLQDREAKTHVLMAQEMVNFVSYCLGSSAWLILTRMKKLREMNTMRENEIGQEVNQLKENARPKYIKADWLQLTPGNQDMTVVGPKPAWLKYLEELKAKEKALAEQKLKEAAEAQSATQGDDSALEKDGEGISTTREGAASGVESAKSEGAATGKRTKVSASKGAIESGPRDPDQEPSKPLSEQHSADKAEGDVTAQKASGEGPTEGQGETVKQVEEEKPKLSFEEQRALELEAKRRKQAEDFKKMKLQHNLEIEAEKEIQTIRLNWQEIFEREKREKEERKRREDEARAKRLARLFKDDFQSSDDDEVINKNLDRGAATGGIKDLMDKVDVHLQVEMNILKKWKDKDGVQDQTQNLPFLPAVNTLAEEKGVPPEVRKQAEEPFFGFRSQTTTPPSLRIKPNKQSSKLRESQDAQATSNSYRGDPSLKQSYEERLERDIMFDEIDPSSMMKTERVVAKKQPHRKMIVNAKTEQDVFMNN